MQKMVKLYTKTHIHTYTGSDSIMAYSVFEACTYIDAHIHTYINAYIHTYIHMQKMVKLYTKTHIHTYTGSDSIMAYSVFEAYTYIHAHIHAYINAYIHTYIHMQKMVKLYTKTHIHTYTGSDSIMAYSVFEAYTYTHT